MTIRKRALTALWSMVAVVSLMAATDSCQKMKPHELHIFHTNDLHSHLRGKRIDPFGLGGLARTKSLLTSLRAQHPDSLTLDAGDWSEGSWTYSNDLGAGMIQAMGRLGYDAAVVGNHDFINGPDVLLSAAREGLAAFPQLSLLAANWNTAKYARAEELGALIRPYTIREVGGVRVGIIGLTTYELVYDSFLAPIRALNPIDEAQKWVNEVQKQAQIIVIVSHNSFSTNVEIARATAGVHAVISGHSHKKAPQAQLVKNAGRDVPVVETGEWGQFLGDLTLWIDPEKQYVGYKSSRLIPVDASIPEDPQMLAWIEDRERALSQRFSVDFNEVVATSAGSFPHDDTAESLQGNLVVDALREQTGADLAIEQLSLTGVGIPAGPLGWADFHDVLPHIADPITRREWHALVWTARGSDLLKISEAFMTVTGLVPMSSPLGWLALSGGQILWDPKAKPSLKSFFIGGFQVDPSRTYRVALTQGLLDAIRMASDLLKLGVWTEKVEDTGVEAWRALAAYAQKRGVIDPKDYDIGRRTLSTRPDLAIKQASLRWDSSSGSLNLTVGHAGTSGETGEARVTCWYGVPGDAVLYRTGEQKWSQIGNGASIPPLRAQEWRDVQIQWRPGAMLTARPTPVRCLVQWEDDPYTGNNQVDRVLGGGQKTPSVSLGK